MRRLFSLLFVLLSLCSMCYSDVILTDTEAEELLTEITLSKQELTDAQTELSQSKRQSEMLEMELTERQKELNEVREISTEQKKYYEEQLSEAERKNDMLSVVIVTVTIALLAVIVF